MKKVLQIVLLFSLVACKKGKSGDETRSFYMGVTPWPADFTDADLTDAYNFINQHCDIVSHHFDDGIPYDEAYHNRPMPSKFQQEVQVRKTKTAAEKKVFLSVAALNLTRHEKADYYREPDASITDSIKNYWKQLAFNDPKMVTAYVHYISYLINQFQPVLVNYGVESNLAQWNRSQFDLYKDFISKVYQQLKASYPTLSFFVSFMVDETPEGLGFASELVPYSDFIGLSAYPYVTVSSSANGNTDPTIFPANYFDRFINLAPAKPLAFAETGYIAENLVIPAFNLNKQGKETWQNDYLELICNLCNNRKAKLIVWFCHKDYDAGNNTLRNLGLYQDLFGLWEDIGLKDETGKERTSYATWLRWMDKKRTD